MKSMAPTLVASRTALPPEGLNFAWGDAAHFGFTLPFRILRLALSATLPGQLMHDLAPALS